MFPFFSQYAQQNVVAFILSPGVSLRLLTEDTMVAVIMFLELYLSLLEAGKTGSVSAGSHRHHTFEDFLFKCVPVFTDSLVATQHCCILQM